MSRSGGILGELDETRQGDLETAPLDLGTARPHAALRAVYEDTRL